MRKHRTRTNHCSNERQTKFCSESNVKQMLKARLRVDRNFMDKLIKRRKEKVYEDKWMTQGTSSRTTRLCKLRYRPVVERIR